MHLARGTLWDHPWWRPVLARRPWVPSALYPHHHCCSPPPLWCHPSPSLLGCPELQLGISGEGGGTQELSEEEYRDESSWQE